MEKRTNIITSTVVSGTSGEEFGAMVSGTAAAIPNPNQSSGPVGPPAMKSPDDCASSMTPASTAVANGSEK